MALPGLTEQALAHVVADVLDDVLDAVHERALGHEARRLLLLEDEEQDEKQDDGDRKPERVLREAKRVEAADDGLRGEARYQLVDLLAQAVQRIAHAMSFPPG